MTTDKILKKWSCKGVNKKAGVDMWNSMAGGFGEQKLPSFDSDNLLKLLQGNGMLNSDALVLDVGCGAGKYAISIADKCKKVIGVDISPKMIELAKEKALETGVANVEFYCLDWSDFDLRKEGYEKSFDLVFAHMTPAVHCGETFQKLSLASKDWCLLSKPTRRTDPVSDFVKGLVGITEKRESCDQEILYGFQLLWLQNKFPYIDYKKQEWNSEKTLEQAYGLYINRVKTYRDISTEEEDRIKDYLQSIARNGLVCEEVDTTITTLYWQV